MRRLTLILSDLYVPEDSVAGGLPRTADLPTLDRLLRFATVEHIGDWRAWLLRVAGGQIADLPIPVLSGNPDSLPRLDNVWLATPVQLEARLDHVRLRDRGLLRVREDERAAWCAEFNGIFGPQYSLRDCGDRAFQLVGVEPVNARTRDPARLLGAEVGPALPGAHATELRRLWTEIEMWLHSSPLNAARERARRPRITAFWLWGNDPAGEKGVAMNPAGIRFHGGDPLMRGLAMRSGNFRDVTSLADVEAAPEHVYVEFAPLTGDAHESLPALEQQWFAPARDALVAGRLESVQVVANDRVFTARPRDRWKFWRRRRGWLESLA